MKYTKKTIVALYRSKKTVFTFQDVALLWNEIDQMKIVRLLSYYVGLGLLHHIRRGVYSKSGDYNPLELATKILVPSYVSFETVLIQAGITFQRYETIFVASYVSRDIVVENQTYAFRHLPDDVLSNPTGISHENETSVASPERAFLDTVYAHKGYYFDNLRPLNWEKVEELLPMYKNKRMVTSLKKYKRQYDLQLGRSQDDPYQNS